jgi:hydrogenase/urease accessory protein HupE
MRPARRAAALLLPLVLAGGPAHAHPLAPALLEIGARGDGVFDVAWKTSAFRASGTDVAPILPAHCRRRTAPAVTAGGGAVVTRWTVDCGSAGIVGRRVGVAGLDAARIDAVLRVTLADGRVVRAVLRAGAPFLTVPERPPRLAVAWDYAVLGIHHVLTGPDHLLFVFGLLLLVASAARLVQVVTAFTVGHSVTLAAAALGLVRLPPDPVEIVIAATVLLLAVELARTVPAATLVRRRPWLMALAFGLLHGLGFAGALRQVGLPAHDVVFALAAFNGGIEIGQLAFVAAVLAARAALHRLAPAPPVWMRAVPVYAMGALATFWCIERGAAMLP